MGWGFAGDYNQPEDDGSGNRPKSSIWDDPNDADDYEYDPSTEPQQQQIGGWFGNERDETEWSKSRRGVTPWNDPNYREPLDNDPDNPYRIKNGYSRTESNIPGHDRYVSARDKYKAARKMAGDVRHPSRIAKRRLKQKFNDMSLGKTWQKKIFSDEGWRW